MKRHPNPVPRTQGDERFRHNRMARHQPEAETLRHGSDHDHRFEERESLSNAPPRSVAEWKVGAGWQALCEAVEPSLGAEGIGIIVEARVTMSDPL